MAEGCLQDGIVGWLRAETGQSGHRRALPFWLLTTDSYEVARSVSQWYGGIPQKHEEAGDFTIRLERETFVVHVDNPNAIVNTLAEDPPSSTGDIPPSSVEQGAADSLGRNTGGGIEPTCGRPHVCLCFRLGDLPDLGCFRLTSSSRLLGQQMKDVERILDSSSGIIDLKLTLQRECVVTRMGMEVALIRPVILAIGHPDREVVEHRVGRVA